MDLIMCFWFVYFPVVGSIGFAAAWLATDYLERARTIESENKERRYLEAVAMLTAEEKREIGIE